MRRRLLLTIVATVVATLVTVGAGTLLLSRVGAREATRDTLEGEVAALAGVVGALPPRSMVGPTPPTRFRDITIALGIEGAGVLALAPDRDLILRDELPAGVSIDDLDLEALRAGATISGHDGRLVWAAAGVPTGRAFTVLALTDEVDGLDGPAVRWFLLASFGSILLGILVAVVLARRLSDPLQAAAATTGRIASGDLSARMPPTATADRTEVGTLSRAIDDMAESLERSRQLERQFLLSVSHDLRTPLTSIRGYAEALRDGAVEEPTRAADVILGESRRLERLVQDLLDLSRLEADAFTLEPRSVDVGDLLADVASGFEHAAGQRGIAIEVDRPPDAALVTADPDRLAQVVANLLENAMRYARSRVRVRVTVTTAEVQVEVTDDGPGIAAEDQPHVFERLYTARHGPRPEESRSGLGLAIVRELVQAMGGQVAVRSEPGLGATLLFTLPGLSRPA